MLFNSVPRYQWLQYQKHDFPYRKASVDRGQYYSETRRFILKKYHVNGI